MAIYHEWNGTVLTITSDSGSSSCDLKGEKGDTGIRGAQGIAGNCAEGTGIASISRTSGDGSAGSIDTYTITLTNGQTSTFEVYNGIDGQGEKGNDGTSIESASIDSNGNLILSLSDGNDIDCGYVRGTDGKDGTSITHAWQGTTLYITSANGTSSADLKGEKGDKGDKGDTPTITTDTTPTENSTNLITSGAVFNALQNVSSDVVWNDLPINSNTVTRPDNVGIVYTKINNMVSVQGAVKLIDRLASSTNATIGTLPVGYRPYRTLLDARMLGGAVYLLTVNTNGTIVVTSYQSDGLSNAYSLYINIEFVAGN